MTPFPYDPALPAAPALVDERGVAVVASFLEQRGWQLRDARPVQVLYRPGASCLVRYAVRATTPEGQARRLSVCAETRAAESRLLPPPPDFEPRYGLAEPVEAASPYLVWAFPYDPGLRHLDRAASAAAAKDAMQGLGSRPLAVEVQPVAYRPRRRAVFRYLAVYRNGQGGRRRAAYAKTLRSAPARRVLHLGRALSGMPLAGGLRLALPCGEVSPNTLLFPRLSGRSLRTLLTGEGPLPDPRRLAAAVGEIAALETRVARTKMLQRTSAVELARHTSALLGAVVPGQRDKVRRVLDAIEQAAASETARITLVHGDLYEAQLFVDGDVIGVLDIDGVGLGDPGLDAGNFCAHLLALALTAPGFRRRLLAYRVLARRAWEERLGLGPEALAWREALCMLQLATGPFRTQQPAWPDGVGRRIDAAVRLSSLQNRTDSP